MKKILQIVLNILIVLLVCAFLGAIFSAVSCLLTSNWDNAPLLFVSGFISVCITSFCIRLIINISTKKLVGSLSVEMEKVKQGNLTYTINSSKFGILKKLSGIVNRILDDIRSLIKDFFQFSESIVEASAKVNSTSEVASVSISEISATVDEIARGASEQAKEAQNRQQQQMRVTKLPGKHDPGKDEQVLDPLVRPQHLQIGHHVLPS